MIATALCSDDPPPHSAIDERSRVLDVHVLGRVQGGAVDDEVARQGGFDSPYFDWSIYGRRTGKVY